MRLVQPPGARSCRDGGEWGVVDDGNEHKYFPGEYQDALDLTTSTADQKLFKAELRERMDRAKTGALTWEYEVKQMAIRPRVLEIRLSRHSGDYGTSMLLRLYFTEPDHVAGLMLILKLAAKSPIHAVGVEEQNEHILQADRRADGWSGN